MLRGCKHDLSDVLLDMIDRKCGEVHRYIPELLCEISVYNYWEPKGHFGCHKQSSFSFFVINFFPSPLPDRDFFSTVTFGRKISDIFTFFPVKFICSACHRRTGKIMWRDRIKLGVIGLSMLVVSLHTLTLCFHLENPSQLVFHPREGKKSNMNVSPDKFTIW